MDPLIIVDIRARTVTAPLTRPIRTASGAIDTSPLLLLDVLTDGGFTGSAYPGFLTNLQVPGMIWTGWAG